MEGLQVKKGKARPPRLVTFSKLLWISVLQILPNLEFSIVSVICPSKAL
jgi:hypothetical protein